MRRLGNAGWLAVTTGAAGLAFAVTPPIQSWWLAIPLWLVAALAAWRWFRSHDTEAAGNLEGSAAIPAPHDERGVLFTGGEWEREYARPLADTPDQESAAIEVSLYPGRQVLLEVLNPFAPITIGARMQIKWSSRLCHNQRPYDYEPRRLAEGARTQFMLAHTNGLEYVQVLGEHNQVIDGWTMNDETAFDIDVTLTRITQERHTVLWERIVRCRIGLFGEAISAELIVAG